MSSYVQNEKLREALSFHTLLVGGNPMTTSAIYALIHKLEKDGGVWFAMGGTNKLVAGMIAQFERLGGVVRLGAPSEVALERLVDIGGDALEPSTSFRRAAHAADLSGTRPILSGVRARISDPARPRPGRRVRGSRA